MTPREELAASIRRLRKRVRLLFVERYGLYGASIGAVATAVLVLLSNRYDALISYTLWIGAFLICALAGVGYGLFKRLDDLAVAISADNRTGLKERLSTAVSLRDSQPGQFEEALISDANTHVASFRPGEVFRHRFGKPHGAFGIAVLLLLAVVILPQLPAFQSKLRRQEVQVMKREGAKLVKIAKDIRKQSDPGHKELRNLANKLSKLGSKMQTGRMTRKMAMLKTQKLSKEVQRKQDELARATQGRKPISQATSELRKANEALMKPPTDKRLAELARKDGPLTESERSELEQAVAKYADPNSRIPIPSELAEALAKLAENKNYQAAMELMRKLSEKLASGKMDKMDEKALRKQLEQLAKALKNTDLDKLAEQMLESAEKLAQMSPEELEKLMEELKKAEKMAQLLAKAGGG